LVSTLKMISNSHPPDTCMITLKMYSKYVLRDTWENFNAFNRMYLYTLYVYVAQHMTADRKSIDSLSDARRPHIQTTDVTAVTP